MCSCVCSLFINVVIWTRIFWKKKQNVDMNFSIVEFYHLNGVWTVEWVKDLLNIREIEDNMGNSPSRLSFGYEKLLSDYIGAIYINYQLLFVGWSSPRTHETLCLFETTSSNVALDQVIRSLCFFLESWLTFFFFLISYNIGQTLKFCHLFCFFEVSCFT